MVMQMIYYDIVINEYKVLIIKYSKKRKNINNPA